MAGGIDELAEDFIGIEEGGFGVEEGVVAGVAGEGEALGVEEEDEAGEAGEANAVGEGFEEMAAVGAVDFAEDVERLDGAGGAVAAGEPVGGTASGRSTGDSLEAG